MTIRMNYSCNKIRVSNYNLGGNLIDLQPICIDSQNNFLFNINYNSNTLSTFCSNILVTFGLSPNCSNSMIIQVTTPETFVSTSFQWKFFSSSNFYFPFDSYQGTPPYIVVQSTNSFSPFMRKYNNLNDFYNDLDFSGICSHNMLLNSTIPFTKLQDRNFYNTLFYLNNGRFETTCSECLLLNEYKTSIANENYFLVEDSLCYPKNNLNITVSYFSNQTCFPFQSNLKTFSYLSYNNSILLRETDQFALFSFIVGPIMALMLFVISPLVYCCKKETGIM